MTQASHDAQREMEQRALRNVRGLLDKIEAAEQEERWTFRRFAVVIGIVVLVFAIALAVLVALVKKPGKTRPVTLEQPPARTAPQ
jgi:hypothetical protein